MLTDSGKFNNLTSIPYPTNEDQAGLFFKCLDYAKNWITSIELHDDDKAGEDFYRDLHNRLEEYSMLKKVVIRTPENNNQYRYATEYLEVLVKKELTSLRDLSIVSSTDSTYLRLFTNRIKALTEQNFVS